MPASLAALALATVVAIPGPSALPPAKDRGILLTSVTLGVTDPNGKVPTLNGVPGAGTNNLDIAVPAAVLPVGTDYQLMATFQAAGYTGTCNGQVTMTQKQGHEQVKLRQVSIGPGQCEAGNIYMVHTAFGAIPDAPGPVTLSFTMSYGDAKAVMKVPMTIAAP